jgi:hypothetical protein
VYAEELDESNWKNSELRRGRRKREIDGGRRRGQPRMERRIRDSHQWNRLKERAGTQGATVEEGRDQYDHCMQ